MFVIVHVVNMIIVLPTLSTFEYYNVDISQIVNAVSTLLVFMTFLYASCRDPGKLKPFAGQDFMELLRDINPIDLCPECEVIKSARSRHCAICNQCIERFDHHCPWINNCVGIKNHNAFIMFLFSIWTKIVITMAANGFSAYMFMNLEEDFKCVDDTCQKFCFYDLCSNQYVHLASCGVCILICIFYFILSSVLLWTHCRNYMSNRTTNERFAKKSRQQSDESVDDDSSIMSMSDFDTTSVSRDESEGRTTSKKMKKAKKKSGCIFNCWKMCSHTKIVPQTKLYNYLAERSEVLTESDISLSGH